MCYSFSGRDIYDSYSRDVIFNDSLSDSYHEFMKLVGSFDDTVERLGSPATFNDAITL